MLKKTVTYTDFYGVSHTEDFYFNLTEAEILEMNYTTYGGLDKMIEKIIATNDTPKIVSMFKELVLASYGEKSPDGKRFIKNDAVREAFSQNQAYSDIFMELATDEQAAADFVNGIVPEKISKAMEDNPEIKNGVMKQLASV